MDGSIKSLIADALFSGRGPGSDDVCSEDSLRCQTRPRI